MFMRYLVISLFVVFVLSQGLLAQTAPEGLFSGHGPVEIKADRLISDQKKGITVFEGSVVARQDNTTLRADRMEVFTDQKGTITRILATGNVRLERQGQSITSSRAEYIQKKGIIIFTGEPVARGEGTTVMGSRIIYQTEDGSTLVEDSRVIIQRQRQDGRP